MRRVVMSSVPPWRRVLGAENLLDGLDAQSSLIVASRVHTVRIATVASQEFEAAGKARLLPFVPVVRAMSWHHQARIWWRQGVMYACV